METIFLTLLNRSITASWLVLAVILLRLLFKRAPKTVAVILWGIVGIRLICPFTFESVLSLLPSAEPVPVDIANAHTPAIESGIPAIDAVVNPILLDSFAPTEIDSANPLQILIPLAAVVWAAGVLVMLLYTLICSLRVRRRVKEAIPLQENIWLCDRIAAPFIFGIFRPRIYLPPRIADPDRSYVLAHENAHLKRRDHWWKPLGFLLLAVYWFNPILWVGYLLFCRDIELACDERVIRQLGVAGKKPYSEALINCSLPKRLIAACPLAFGEVGVKGRVKTVLHYKKPTLWLVIAAVAACIAVVAGFLTDPVETSLYAGGGNVYSYVHGIEQNVAVVSLYPEQERFLFSTSRLSSYLAEGCYTEKRRVPDFVYRGWEESLHLSQG